MKNRSQNSSKITEIWQKRVSGNNPLFVIAFLSHFHRFGFHFGSILAPFWLHLRRIWDRKGQLFFKDAPRDDFYRFLLILDLIWEGFWALNRFQGLEKIYLAILFLSNITPRASNVLAKNVLAIFVLWRRVWMGSYTYTHIYWRFYDIYTKKKETPRCHPQGHNARGLHPSVVRLKPKTNPQNLPQLLS